MNTINYRKENEHEIAYIRQVYKNTFCRVPNVCAVLNVILVCLCETSYVSNFDDLNEVV